MTETQSLFRAEQVSQRFRTNDGKPLTVLDHIDLSLQEGEILALLGKSGAGKSTLLRILSGLTQPSSGTVFYHNRPIAGPVKDVAMVFQNFALLPWMTVLQNVELGLEAQGRPASERRKRALKVIDDLGLDGFESAYPKELSGGMRQRVGLARALVIEPECLLMDEPFSSLDVLTAETLRHELIDLWLEGNTPLKGIILVTHSIEEAALMANRILIFDANPGRIRAELHVSTPLPRETDQPYFRKLVDDIYTIMTSDRDPRTRTGRQRRHHKINIAYRLPDVESAEIVAFLDALWQEDKKPVGPIDLPHLTEQYRIDTQRIFPLTEALDLLGLATIESGDFLLTPIGQSFVQGDIQERKQIFARQLIALIPLAASISEALHQNEQHRLNESVFLKTLEDALSDEESDRVLKVIIDWGRYAETFAYDYDSGDLSLEDPDEAA